MNKTNTTTTTNELNDADLAAVSGGVIERPDGSTCTDRLAADHASAGAAHRDTRHWSQGLAA